MRLAKTLLTKVTTSVHRRALFMAKPIDGRARVPEPALRVEIGRLEPHDLAAYGRFRPRQSPRSIRRRIERGNVCYAAWHRGRIVHAAWAATGRARVSYLDRDLLLGEDDVYMFDSFTLPAYRRKALTATREALLLARFAERGYRRAVGVVAVENDAGRGWSRSLGYRPLGLYGYRRLGPFSRHWRRSFDGEAIPPLVPSE